MELQSFSCDLSSRLFTSPRLYQQQFDDRWLVFAPDYPGLPVLADRRMHSLLHAFKDGSSVGELLSKRLPATRDLDEAFSAIGFLEERGFLTSSGAAAPYQVSSEEHQRVPNQFSVWLHINNACNLDCSYCFVQEQSDEAMSREILERTVDQVAATALYNKATNVVIKFAGGEPTLTVASMEAAYDRLTAALKETEVALQFVVLSNGTAIDARTISFLQRPGVGIGISVDGYKQYHDLHRVFKGSRKGSWDAIDRNIGRLRQHGITPHIMATLTSESCLGLVELAHWIFDQGLSTRLNVVRPQHQASDDHARRVKDFDELALACRIAFSKLFDEIDQGRLKVDLARQLYICELHFDYPLNGPACGMGRSHVVFNHRGDLTDCVMTVNTASTPASDDLLADVRKTGTDLPCHRKLVDGGDDCLECQWFKVCGGGCPAANRGVHGHPYTQSPLCDFYRYVIPRYLESLGKQMLEQQKASCDEKSHQSMSIYAAV